MHAQNLHSLLPKPRLDNSRAHQVLTPDAKKEHAESDILQKNCHAKIEKINLTTFG